MSDLVAMPQRERSALALYKRERDKWEDQYSTYLRVIAREQCALKISSEMSDAEIAELDELVVAKANFASKHPWWILVGSLGVLWFPAPVIEIYPPAVLGLFVGFPGFVWSLHLLESYFPGFFAARKRLQKLCGENYLPYDAVRKSAYYGR